MKKIAQIVLVSVMLVAQLQVNANSFNERGRPFNYDCKILAILYISGLYVATCSCIYSLATKWITFVICTSTIITIAI